MSTMEPLADKVAIVTGASSGMGEAIARALVLIGIHVIAVARSENKLKRIGDSLRGSRGTFHPVRCDLRREEDILRVFQYAEDKFKGVDILVNVAGITYFEPITNGTTEHFRSIMDVNTIAPAITTREAVKLIRRYGKRGHIVNINSLDGFKLSPFEISLYEASKFALHAITEKVRQEIFIRHDPIKVTGIYPGLTNTELISKSAPPLLAIGARFVPHLRPQDIADSVLFALRAPGNVQIEQLVVTPLHGFIN